MGNISSGLYGSTKWYNLEIISPTLSNNGPSLSRASPIFNNMGVKFFNTSNTLSLTFCEVGDKGLVDKSSFFLRLETSSRCSGFLTAVA